MDHLALGGEADFTKGGLVGAAEDFIHQGPARLAHVEALERFAAIEAGERFADHLHGGVGLGGELGWDRADLGIAGLGGSEGCGKALVGWRRQLRAVGLGDQDAVAILLADRVNVWRVHAIAHHDRAAIAQLPQLADQIAAIHGLQ